MYRPSGFSSILIHLLHITIKNNHIDIYVGSHAEAETKGVYETEVYLLEEGQPDETEVQPDEAEEESTEPVEEETPRQ